MDHPTFTSRLDNYHVKITKHPAEISLEILNLETGGISSIIIKDQDLSSDNTKWCSLEEFYQNLIQGLQKDSKTCRFEILQEIQGLKVSLIRMNQAPSDMPETLSYILKEISSMSSEHLKKVQQRIQDSPDITCCLPEKIMRTLFVMSLQTQQSLAERLQECESQVKVTKGDVSTIVKIDFKNFKDDLKKLGENNKIYDQRLKEIQGDMMKVQKKTPEENNHHSKEKDEKLEKELKQIQEENKMLREELREFKRMLDNKVDQPKREIDRLEEIELVKSLTIKVAEVQRNYNNKEIDEKLDKLRKLIDDNQKPISPAIETTWKQEFKAFKEETNTLLKELKTNLEEQNKQTNEKLQTLSTNFENMKKTLETLDNGSKILDENITSIEQEISRIQDQIDALRVTPEVNQNIINYIDTIIKDLRRTLRGDVESIEQKVSGLDAQIKICLDQVDICQAQIVTLQNAPDDNNGEIIASLSAQLEEHKESAHQKIQNLSNKVEGISLLSEQLQAAEDKLKLEIESTHITLAELINIQVEDLKKDVNDKNKLFSQKIAILERRFIPSKTDLQPFQPLKPMPVFNMDLEDLAVKFEPGRKTISCNSMFAFSEKSCYSQERLPDTGKYSVSFRYEGGEFKDNASLCFGLFPYDDRQNPQESKHKYLIDVINHEAYLEENRFAFDAVNLQDGEIITVYVDIEKKSVSFSLGDRVGLNYPMSEWLTGKMYCGFFVKNNKNLKVSFV